MVMLRRMWGTWDGPSGFFSGCCWLGGRVEAEVWEGGNRIMSLGFPILRALSLKPR